VPVTCEDLGSIVGMCEIIAREDMKRIFRFENRESLFRTLDQKNQMTCIGEKV
jgi:hypothetical protein